MMAEVAPRLTAEQLASLPDAGQRLELVEGVLHHMAPAGFRHGRIAAKLLRRIGDYAERHGLGETLTAETGFLIRQQPDTVRAADVAYLSRDRLLPFADHPGYLPLAPDLVAEVVSPHDRWSDVEAKVQDWLQAGVDVVLVVDPQTATIHTYRPHCAIEVHASGHLDLGDLMPGLRLDIAELFN